MPPKHLKSLGYLVLRLVRRLICRAVARPIRRSRRRLRQHRRSLTKLMEKLHRKYVFRREMRRLCNLPSTSHLPATVLSRLIYGWGNSWSVSYEYTRAFLKHARTANGPILECGSGLSTILLGVVAQRNGTKVWSLEHDPFWAAKIRSTLKRYNIKSVELYEINLRDYGSYWWYDPPKGEMPRQFSLVVCDGPPGKTPGGRYGMLPTMKTHLKPGCVVLLDDAQRAAEKENIARWAEELDTSYRIEGITSPFGILEVPALEEQFCYSRESPGTGTGENSFRERQYTGSPLSEKNSSETVW